MAAYQPWLQLVHHSCAEHAQSGSFLSFIDSTRRVPVLVVVVLSPPLSAKLYFSNNAELYLPCSLPVNYALTANKIHRLRGRCALDNRLQLISFIIEALQTFKVTVTRVAPNAGTCFALAKVQGNGTLHNNSIRVTKRLMHVAGSVR